MEELKIYKFQAESIKEALRIVANVLNSRDRETSLDRSVMVATELIENVIKKTPDKRVKHF